MGVRIDEARAYDLAGGIDHLRGFAHGFADVRDAAVFDRDVNAAAGGAGAVDHATVPDEQIVVHCVPVLAEEVFLIGGQAESVAFRGELKSLKLSHVFWRLTTVDS